MTTQTKIKQLQDILHARLPMIERWENVEVYVDQDNFTIHWSKPKTTSNTHPFESKECPISDIDAMIKRNTERLYNEVKSYK